MWRFWVLFAVVWSGGGPTVRRLMLMLATVIVLVAGGAVFAVWLPRVLDRQLSSRNAEVDGRSRRSP